MLDCSGSFRAFLGFALLLSQGLRRLSLAHLRKALGLEREALCPGRLPRLLQCKHPSAQRQNQKHATDGDQALQAAEHAFVLARVLALEFHGAGFGLRALTLRIDALARRPAAGEKVDGALEFEARSFGVVNRGKTAEKHD